MRTLFTVFASSEKTEKELPVSFPMSLTGAALREQLDAILDITLPIALAMKAKPSNRSAKQGELRRARG